MQNGDRVQFVSCPELPAVTDSATFYYLQNSDKLYLGSQLIANNVKDVQNSETPGKLRITQFDGSTREIDIPGNAFGIDCYKGKFPLDFTSPGGVIDEWEIYGNNPIVENKTGDLPIEVSATAGNTVDWTIYGNDDNGTENLFDGTTIQKGRIDNGVPGYASDTLEAAFENGVITFATTANYRGVYFDPIAIDSAFTFTFSRISGEAAFYFDYYADDMTYISRNSTNQTSSPITITFSPPQNAKFVRLSIRGISANTYIIADIMLVKGSTAPDYYIPYQKGVGENTEITGELPIDFRSNGDDLLGYRIYGTADGAGVQTEQHGYKLPLTITSGADSKDTDIYIGDSKLGEAEYVDYGEQKIYRRILFMTHNDKHFITKDNKDFCLRRRGYSG